MEEKYLIWAIICLAAALLLFAIEIFIPSGGVIGFASAIALIAGIVMLFKVNTTLGLIGIVLSLIAIPLLIMLAIRIWPSTPFAQFLTLKNSKPPIDPNKPDEIVDDDLQKLVGKTGKAMTDLRPVGTCIIDGKRHECLAESGVIESGSEVEVTTADGMQIKVRSKS